jgi:hypothetical protein
MISALDKRPDQRRCDGEFGDHLKQMGFEGKCTLKRLLPEQSTSFRQIQAWPVFLDWHSGGA